MIKRPAPETESDPRCIRCHSDTQPSLAEYCPMGETTMRFGSSSPLSVSGENSFDPKGSISFY